jgi:hypothetical protein
VALSSPTATTASAWAAAGATYPGFRATATDQAGNQSDWTYEPASASTLSGKRAH